jgi:VanZ family protein
MPLGMAGYLAMRRFKSHAWAIVAPVALGTLLSATVEMVQLFTPSRFCSAVDLVDNMLGSVLGVAVGILFTRIVDIPAMGSRWRVRDRRAVALLFCWIAFLLFPLFPDLSLYSWRAKLAAFVHGPSISPAAMVLGAAEWFAVGRLLTAAEGKSSWRWLLLVLVLVPVQFGIANHSPMPGDFAGAALGALLFCVAGTGPGADRAAGVLLLAALTIRGLAPFHFEGPPQSFVWIPFGGVLATAWQNAISILLGKLFQYGAAIFLLNFAGLSLVRATALVTLVLAVIEVLQTRIPGHVPEVTDPLLAILLALVLVVLQRQRDEPQSLVLA